MADQINNNILNPVAHFNFIDKTWLTQVLNKYLNANCEILNLTFENMSGKEGFLSEIIFITVSLKVDNCTRDKYLVVKCMPQSEAARKFVINGSLAKREVDFYKFTESELFKSVLNKSVLKLVIPEVIFCEYDNNDMTIVMNNLKRLNYKTLILRDGSSLDQTLRALESLALIHATGLFHFKKYHTYGIKKFLDFSFFDQVLGKHIQKLSEIFQGDEELSKIFEKLVPFSKKIRSYSLMHPLFETVIHGDFWSGQCMYSEDEKEVCILDWQFANVGNPIVDLMGMFCMSTDPVVLENNLDQILKHYWKELCTNLEQNDVVPTCSYEEFVNCVERHWMTGFNYIAVSLNAFLSENNISDKRLRGLMKFLHKRKVFSGFLEEVD